MNDNTSLGRIAVMLAMGSEQEQANLLEKAKKLGYTACIGKVGSMDSGKIFAAVQTAAKREKIVNSVYREEHAIYHAVLEAYNGICRGQPGLGNILRSAGLSFSIVKGPRLKGEPTDGEWLAVVLYGNIGAPIKGFEHEVIGMGINPL